MGMSPLGQGGPLDAAVSSVRDRGGLFRIGVIIDPLLESEQTGDEPGIRQAEEGVADSGRAAEQPRLDEDLGMREAQGAGLAEKGGAKAPGGCEKSRVAEPLRRMDEDV